MIPIASFISDFWNDQLVEHDRQWLFLVLLGFVGSFAFIRMSTRLMRSPRVPWWPGSVETGGVHVHHLVFGIVLMMVAGTISFAGFATSPLYEICALFFGIGIGLTIDEFALWVHLDDVYWAEEGRRSVDAVVIATLICGLLLMGFLPFSTDAGAPTIFVTALVALALSVVAVMKGKIVLGVAGMLLPLLSLIGAVRLAKPGSAWAQRRYPAGSRKLARAERRYERHTRRYQRFQDSLAGAPEARD
jgi:lysyl-tRNA synthetase, class II